jgi:hypothetical protein
MHRVMALANASAIIRAFFFMVLLERSQSTLLSI